MSKTSPHMQDIQRKQMFSYIFTQIITTKFSSLKLDAGLFTCSNKTIFKV